MEQFYSTLYSFNDFLARRQFSEFDVKDIVVLLHKIAGVILGANLGDFSAFYTAAGDASAKVSDIFGNCV